MKTFRLKLLLTFIFWIILLQAYPQKNIKESFVEAKKASYDSCQKTNFLIKKKTKKIAGKLAISIAGKKAKVFTDDNSNENFKEFSYVGEIKESDFVLIKKAGYNDEEFYIVNRATGNTDTLIGMPIFSNDRVNFVCLGNPGTDEAQRLQICEIQNARITTMAIFEGKKNTFFENASCITRNSLLLKDNKGKYWRLSFTLSSNKIR